MTLNNDPLAVYAWKRWCFLKARLRYRVVKFPITGLKISKQVKTANIFAMISTAKPCTSHLLYHSTF